MPGSAVIHKIDVLMQDEKNLALRVNDIIRYRRGNLVIERCTNVQQQRKPKSFIVVHFHKKGIEMINIAGILYSKVVRDTILVFFSNKDT